MFSKTEILFYIVLQLLIVLQIRIFFENFQNLAWVKSFTICIELDDNLEIFCQLFRTMFSIVSEKHSSKVISFILDLLTPLIQQSDSVSQELMDIILSNIIEPFKVSNSFIIN